MESIEPGLGVEAMDGPSGTEAVCSRLETEPSGMSGRSGSFLFASKLLSSIQKDFENESMGSRLTSTKDHLVKMDAADVEIRDSDTDGESVDEEVSWFEQPSWDQNETENDVLEDVSDVESISDGEKDGVEPLESVLMDEQVVIMPVLHALEKVKEVERRQSASSTSSRSAEDTSDFAWDVDFDEMIDKLDDAIGGASSTDSSRAAVVQEIGKLRKVWRKQRRSVHSTFAGMIRTQNKLSGAVSAQKRKVELMMKKPPVIRKRHQLSFTFGVLGCWLSLYVLLQHRDFFPVFYSFTILALSFYRYFEYHASKFHYFMIDFCYLVQLILMMYLFVYPSSPHLFCVIFAISNGPILWAISVWRNSLVFHDIDKFTSCLLHLFPPIVTYTVRWHPREHHRICTNAKCTIDWSDSMIWPLIFYLFWQLTYFLKVQVADGRKLARDPEVMTSIRWMSRSGELLASLHHADSFAFFVYIQVLYHFVCLVLVKWFFRCQTAHFIFLLMMLYSAVSNGANYYFEAFFIKYLRSILPSEDVQTRLNEIAASIKLQKIKERKARHALAKRRKAKKAEEKRIRKFRRLGGDQVVPEAPPPPSPSRIEVWTNNRSERFRNVQTPPMTPSSNLHEKEGWNVPVARLVGTAIVVIILFVILDVTWSLAQ